MSRGRTTALGFATVALLGLLVAWLIAGRESPPPGGRARLAAGRGLASALGPGSASGAPQAGARISPGSGKLGQRLTYVGELNSATQLRVRFRKPRDAGAFHWGEPVISSAGRWGARSRRTADSSGFLEVDAAAGARVEIPLQVFAYGNVSVPGIEVEMDDGRGPRVSRLPVSLVTIVPIVPMSDSTADLRALHGPLEAPWWERVPWLWVAAAIALLVGAYALWRMRRRPKKVAPPVVPAAVRRRDPVAEALSELAALRKLGLPAQGLFAEHAWRLTRILRRFLEDTLRASRPGDTSAELVHRLAAAALDPEELTQVDGLLRVWDRVKFARAESNADEAARAEAAVEALVRRRAAPSSPERAA